MRIHTDPLLILDKSTKIWLYSPFSDLFWTCKRNYIRFLINRRMVNTIRFRLTWQRMSIPPCVVYVLSLGLYRWRDILLYMCVYTLVCAICFGTATNALSAAVVFTYRQGNVFGILINQPEFRLCLPCTDWFGTKLILSVYCSKSIGKWLIRTDFGSF